MTVAAEHPAEDEARRLRETLEAIDETFILVSADWRILDLNRAAAALNGRAAAQMIGRNFFDVWADIKGTSSEHAYRQAMASRRSGAVRYRYIDHRSDLWLETRVFPSGDGLALFTRDLTRERETERRLRDAEADAAVAVQAARLGTWSYEPDSGRLDWNAQHRALFNMPLEAPVSYDTLLAGIHPADRDRVDALVRAATDPSGTGELAVDYRTAGSGPTRWLEAQGRALFQDGRCVRLTGVVQDVTERRLGQAELEESEARFRAIAEATPMLVFVTTRHGMNTYTNPQFSEYTGLTPSALLDDRWMEVVHAGDRQRVVGVWSDAVAQGGTYENEFRLRRHDGAYRWFLVRGMPLRAQPRDGETEGEVMQWLGTCTDIQDMMEARQVLARDRDAMERLVADRTTALDASIKRLHENEARLRAVFENSSDYLVLFRVDRVRGPVYLDLNSRAAAVMGRPLDELVGRTGREVFGDTELTADAEAHLARAVARPNEPYRYSARRPYGDSPRDLDVTALAFDGPDGEQLLLLSARDVTEQRALEEALRQSQKMEAVGQLTGGIAHDFNNILMGISGSLELMQDRIGGGRLNEVDRYVVTALGAVRRAAALTHRLLSFARRQPLDPRPADLNRLVTGLEEMIRRAVGPSVVVSEVLAEGLWPTFCDANQLENAVLNLCLNARDAMPEGGTLRIATYNAVLDDDDCASQGEARPGEYATVAVTDTGQGMTPEVAERVFEPFFTTKPVGQGTGLGLSMLYGFVRQSDGHVSIDSAPGRGTTVRLYLPRHRGQLGAPEPRPAATASIASATARKTVLVVEDEAVVRMLAVEVLEQMGHTPLEAADGPAALRLMETCPPVALLLTDVGLPGMDGRQLAEAARARQAGLPVLFMTGYDHHVAAGDGTLAPGMELIAKPFTLESLGRKLGAMLAEPPPGREAAP